MLKEVFFVNENDQIEINFDALELLVGAQMIRYIKDDITVGYEPILVDVYNKDAVSVYMFNRFTENTIAYQYFGATKKWNFTVIYKDQKDKLMDVWSSL